MFPRLLRNLTWLGVVAGVFVAACSIEEIGKDTGFAEVGDACVECQGILVECTSTSTNESQFVECRDQWQECQIGRGLGPDKCGNPSDNDACDLCRKRMIECKNTTDDEASCETQFSVCKAFLITRSDIEANCTANDVVPPQVSCGICQKDFAVCMSDVSNENPLALCTTKFETCLTSHTLDTSSCSTPSGKDACTLCVAQHTDCAAAAGPSCNEGFDQCAGTIAAQYACEPTSGAGGGGGAGGEASGGGGTGGAGGGSTGTCSHDECTPGLPLERTCSACATEVCDQDEWCCDFDWDAQCVTIAQSKPSCSC